MNAVTIPNPPPAFAILGLFGLYSAMVRNMKVRSRKKKSAMRPALERREPMLGVKERTEMRWSVIV